MKENLKLPHVVVIIPCWNGEKWIARALQSTLDQNYPDLEVIVVDDGSTDDTNEIVQRWIIEFGARMNHPRIILQSHQGAQVARNRGMAESRAPYIIFLDADDYLGPGCLAGLAASLGRGCADLAFTSYFIEEVSGHRQGPFRLDSADPSMIFRKWLDGIYVPPCGILWRKAFVAKIGGWDEELLINQDGELVLRAIARGAKIAMSETGYAIYFQHDSATRTSRQISQPAFNSRLSALRKIKSEADQAEIDASLQIGRCYYMMAHECYRAGLNTMAIDTLHAARKCGSVGTADYVASLTKFLRLRA